LVPAARRIAAALAASPMQIVQTSVFRNWIVSYMARPAEATPPGLLM